ncbi:amidohydrolase [Tropicibacter oceani]|uniref:Amidohydrolase n=1 Tax=Tropicibacter oceani TaxID=3058420 RepID=A0ABY8QCM0_9RHOB|nr:amidohydrolase [Tropicibacter oceani]WGW02369.1 amidohydrolase [Tropicibacter oceani]
MRLSNLDITELTDWRHMLHRVPELSGEEEQTARHVVQMLQATDPDQIVTGLGGHGVAALYRGALPGPCVMLRCELDALPIEELGEVAHKSQTPGKAHLCGHDGHMTMLAAMARMLGRQRPLRGSVILMFQPAEENGEGARAVVADPAYAQLRPDYVFAIHNMPGLPLGAVALRPGPACCASRGMRITLQGQTAHAAEPEEGRSPMVALSRLMPDLTALSQGTPEDMDFALATVTHARMGEASFGVAPGHAEFFVTLRTLVDDTMAALVARAEALVAEQASAAGLTFEIGYEDIFDATVNDPEAADLAWRAIETIGVPLGQEGLPIRASEDVGCFGGSAKLAFMLLGAGETCPAVHTPRYDFPDDLIARGAAIYSAILKDILGPEGK